MKKPDIVLLVAAAKMGWGHWDVPCLLSPTEHAALKKAGLLDRDDCAAWLGRVGNRVAPKGKKARTNRGD